jgi:hypothetical protein
MFMNSSTGLRAIPAHGPWNPALLPRTPASPAPSPGFRISSSWAIDFTRCSAAVQLNPVCSLLPGPRSRLLPHLGPETQPISTSGPLPLSFPAHGPCILSPSCSWALDPSCPLLLLNSGAPPRLSTPEPWKPTSSCTGSRAQDPDALPSPKSWTQLLLTPRSWTPVTFCSWALDPRSILLQKPGSRSSSSPFLIQC